MMFVEINGWSTFAFLREHLLYYEGYSYVIMSTQSPDDAPLEGWKHSTLSINFISL